MATLDVLYLETGSGGIKRRIDIASVTFCHIMKQCKKMLKSLILNVTLCPSNLKIHWITTSLAVPTHTVKAQEQPLPIKIK